MAKNIHKGSELSNISKTWDENERARQNEGNATGEPLPAATGNEDLDQVIRKEASEYDHANKEDRLMDGERATQRDQDAP